MTKRSQLLRCAIYTRKSSEEGLDQDFNSLDAQFEACAAYISSQRHEGWKLLPKRYDDGGFSGGNVQRPALQALLTDIAAGQIDLVVVYKIDRLTRSLTDFVKMVEVFDRHQTSFVSVTQQFNTTTSMGRLTLNVLLSFAQFEREVTGERIRDKIAASKQKGLWMGGPVPLGYDLKDRKLMVNAKEAAVVRRLFERYRTLGNVMQLQAELDAKRVRSKVRISRSGNRSGGKTISRGGLYLILRNRTYRGEVVHQGKVYPGQHAAIIAKPLWDAVQAKLEENRREQRNGARAKVASLLAGMIGTSDGDTLVPTHTHRHGRRYRYYSLRASEARGKNEDPLNLPAHDLEEAVEATWCALLQAKDLDQQLGLSHGGRRVREAGQEKALAWTQRTLPDQRQILLDLGVAVVVSTDTLTLRVPEDRLRHWLLGTPICGQTTTPSKQACLTSTVPISLQRVRGGTRILGADPESDATSTAHIREQFLAKIALGRKWAQELIDGEIDSLKSLSKREGHAESYLYDVIRIGCLAPSLVQALVDGKPLRRMGVEAFKDGLPREWSEQAKILTC